MKYVLAIDQGTTSSRAVLYDKDLNIVSIGQEAFPQHFPESDWVEHDLEELWSSVVGSIRQALRGVKDSSFKPSDIAAIGITNQRETFGLWERSTGKALGPAIVWQCRRSAKICEKLKKSAVARQLTHKTGLVLDPYFSGTKVKWLFENRPGLRQRAARGEIAFGTIDTFLIWRLTGGRAHVTDVSNASRTLFMDIQKLEWSDFLLKALGVPREILPQICDSDAEFGLTQGLTELPDGIPIRAVLGDQQAALFGQNCLRVGEAKLTYGTGAFLLMNTGDKIKRSKLALSTVAWKIRGKATYALEGSVFVAGAAVQWLRDGLEILEKSSDVEALARSVPDSDGVFFIPALSGLGSPHWRPEAKGLLGGLTRRSQRGHIARACLEGIAFSVGDLFFGLLKDSGLKVKQLRVDGGAAMNLLLLEFQASLLQIVIQRPRDIESTARGAASLAALAVGLVETIAELTQKNPVAIEVKSALRPSEAKDLQQKWERRVRGLLAGAY